MKYVKLFLFFTLFINVAILAQTKAVSINWKGNDSAVFILI